MESKQILLINDLPGYGKVALAAMMPVLAHMGIFCIHCLRRWYRIHWIMVSLKLWKPQSI